MKGSPLSHHFFHLSLTVPSWSPLLTLLNLNTLSWFPLGFSLWFLFLLIFYHSFWMFSPLLLIFTTTYYFSAPESIVRPELSPVIHLLQIKEVYMKRDSSNELYFFVLPVSSAVTMRKISMRQNSVVSEAHRRMVRCLPWVLEGSFCHTEESRY